MSFYLVLLDFCGFYWVLLGSTRFYWVFPTLERISWVFAGFLLGCTLIYRFRYFSLGIFFSVFSGVNLISKQISFGVETRQRF